MGFTSVTVLFLLCFLLNAKLSHNNIFSEVQVLSKRKKKNAGGINEKEKTLDIYLGLWFKIYVVAIVKIDID